MTWSPKLWLWRGFLDLIDLNKINLPGLSNLGGFLNSVITIKPVTGGMVNKYQPKKNRNPHEKLSTRALVQ